MSNTALTANEIFELNNNFERAGYKLQLGTLLSGFSRGLDDGSIVIGGSFLTEATHIKPTVTSLPSGVSVDVDTQDGAYSITLPADLYGKTFLGGSMSIGVGVDWNNGAPDCSGAGLGKVMDAVCINMGNATRAPKIWIRSVAAETPYAPASVAGAVISFVFIVK